jgi:hypothetical protein
MIMTGFCVVVLALMTMFFMEDADPNQEFYPWAHALAVLMFWSGAVMMIIGAVVFVWRLFA